MATYTNLTDVNIASSTEIGGAVTLAGATNIAGKANILGAVTGIKSSVVYTWTNTNANFSELANVVAQTVAVIRGL